MDGFEWNKIAASILLAGLIAMVSGKITDILYHPQLKLEKRGFQVEIEEAPVVDSSKPVVEVKIDIHALMQAADPKKGEDNFAKCAVCHDPSKGGHDKVGPNLWGVVGAPKAHRGAEYPYSAAMLAKGGKWEYEEMYHFLNGPKLFIPGTKMGFAGFKKPEDVANMVAYLRTLNDNPVPLP